MSGVGSAWPLDPHDPSLPESIREIVDKARTSWLRNAEVFEVLSHATEGTLPLSGAAPEVPEGGCLFLIDRRSCRMFRKDGHQWRKKADGKTVRETHEKLRVGSAERLNCYYAHADGDSSLQRRCYWLLDPHSDYAVLMHYLNATSTRAQRTQRAPGLARASVESGYGTSTSAEPHVLRPQRANRGHNSRYSGTLFDEGSSLGLEATTASSDADFDPSQDSFRGSEQSFNGGAPDLFNGYTTSSGQVTRYQREPSATKYQQRVAADSAPDALAVLDRFPSDVSLGLELMAAAGGVSFTTGNETAMQRPNPALWGSHHASQQASATSYEEAISQRYAAQLQGQIVGDQLGSLQKKTYDNHLGAAQLQHRSPDRGLFLSSSSLHQNQPTAPSPGVLYVSQSLVQHQRNGSFSSVGRGNSLTNRQALFGQLSLGGESEGERPPGGIITLSSLDFADEEEPHNVQSGPPSFSRLPSLRLSFDASSPQTNLPPRLPSLTMGGGVGSPPTRDGPPRHGSLVRLPSSSAGRVLEALQVQAPHGALLDMHVDAWPGVDDDDSAPVAGNDNVMHGAAPTSIDLPPPESPNSRLTRDAGIAFVGAGAWTRSGHQKTTNMETGGHHRQSLQDASSGATKAFADEERQRPANVVSRDSSSPSQTVENDQSTTGTVAHQLHPSPPAPLGLAEEMAGASVTASTSPLPLFVGAAAVPADSPPSSSEDCRRIMADRASRLARPSPSSLARASPTSFIGTASLSADGRRQMPTACPLVRQVDRAAAAAAATHDLRAAKLEPLRAQRSSEVPLRVAGEGTTSGTPTETSVHGNQSASMAEEDATDLIDAGNPLFRFKSFLGGPRVLMSAPNSFQRTLGQVDGDTDPSPGAVPALADHRLGSRGDDEEVEVMTRRLLKNMSIDENDAVVALHSVRATLAREAFPSITEESSGAQGSAATGSDSFSLSITDDDGSGPAALRFHIMDFTPESAAVTGGDKMFVTGWIEKASGKWEPRVHVKFGQTEVPAVMINPTVLKCMIPHVDAPQLVELCITLGDGVPASNVMSFEFQHVASWQGRHDQAVFS